jgi:hypothetical protein
MKRNKNTGKIRKTRVANGAEVITSQDVLQRMRQKANIIQVKQPKLPKITIKKEHKQLDVGLWSKKRLVDPSNTTKKQPPAEPLRVKSTRQSKQPIKFQP